MHFQMIINMAFLSVLSISMQVKKKKKVANILNHYQRNKLELAKRVHTGEAQVKHSCALSPHSSDINF